MKDWKVPGILILLAILALEVGWLAGHPRETAAKPSPDAPMTESPASIRRLMAAGALPTNISFRPGTARP